MRYIITVEFWKKLAKKIASNQQDEWPILFCQNKSHWYLNDFNLEAKMGKKTFKGQLTVVNSVEELIEFPPLGANSPLHPSSITPPHSPSTYPPSPSSSPIPIKGVSSCHDETDNTCCYLIVYADIKKYVFYHRLGVLENGQFEWVTFDAVKVDLAEIIDPIEMLRGAGKNNLTLMRYRFAPSLNLSKLYSTRCLIIGTGTLGCNIARSLLTWGIENISFIDNSCVSHSNLLRQSLFEFNDLGRSKAVAAADRIGQIYPPAKSTVRGYEYQIPMPDHPDTVKDLEERVDMLENLINGHDIVFLCTDNKESRWLPTIIALTNNKPLINLAVGFDSWVVMRHPLKAKETNESIFRSVAKSMPIPILGLSKRSDFGRSSSHSQGSSFNNNYQWDRLSIEQIGCYFCTSVEGIVNTVKDRQIDERCTVTRGGTSAVSSACAVELAISMLTHPEGFYAPAEINDQTQSSSSLSVRFPPQQIRGSINFLTMKQCLARRNPQCCACSTKILDYYNDKLTRLKFLENVCQDSQILKRITCLDQFEITTSRDNLLEIDEDF